VTSLFATPALPFAALVILLALREAQRRLPGRVARVATATVALGAFLLVARLIAAPLPSERALTWQANQGPSGPGSIPANVVMVEVERPACAPAGDGWIAPPVVTETPVAVVITLRLADGFSGCLGTLGNDPWNLPGGPLPGVSGYLMGTLLPVTLAMPLGGRLLLDGSGLLPTPRFRF
jgi:hypothetical protein